MRHHLGAAVRSLSTAEHRLDTVITGTLLALGSTVAPVLVVALLGYVVRVVRGASGVDAELPAFDEWTGVLLDGGRAALATGPLHLPGAAVFAFVVGFDRTHLVAPSLFFGLRRGALPSLDLFVGVLSIVVLEIVAGYLSAAALVAVARGESVGVEVAEAALDIARDGTFARALSVALAVGTVGRVLSGVAAAVPLFGLPAGAAVSFAALVVGASVVGRTTPSVGGVGGRTDGIPFDASAANASADGVRE
ncbi:Protein of unknown function [Halopelagius inordinatus]|uniref:DUF4013 domain-containing protein n=1 Tax=Halopelagius inordinatus TaxID=553467 RepID=A0A1I2MNQ0_9EURY|nr:DUF4013 domain-containing protein [Halopelagius inordinatus]SFF90761.1 Protein of unknown function [Halopelagius inordinatus]